MVNDGLNISQQQNEGNAQVIRPLDLSYLDRAIQQQNYDKRAKKAEEKARQGQFQKGLASLHSVDIFHAHQPYFAQKQQELYDWARNGNAAAIIKGGDTEKLMDFQKQVADLQTEAAMSKQYGTQVYAAGKEGMSKGWESFIPEAKEAYEAANQPFAGKKGEKPSFAFDQSKFQKEVTKAEMHEDAMKNRGTLYPTSFPRKNADGSVTETTVTQFGPKEALETARLTINNDPRYVAKANREFAKLKPEEQMLYIDPKTKQPSAVEYLAQEQAKQIVVTPKVKQTQTQGKSDFNLQFGNGMATNGKYNFVEQGRERVSASGSVLDKLTGKKKTTPYKVISIQRTDAGENKGFLFDDPENPGEKIEVVPKEYEQLPNGDWELLGAKKEGGDIIRIPEKNVTSDMKAITGVSLNEILKGQGNTGETKVSSSKAVAHKTGSRMKTREGWARFNGTKWVLE